MSAVKKNNAKNNNDIRAKWSHIVRLCDNYKDLLGRAEKKIQHYEQQTEKLRDENEQLLLLLQSMEDKKSEIKQANNTINTKLQNVIQRIETILQDEAA